MLYWLLYLKLFHYFPPFRIFRYLTFRTAFASLTAMFTGLIIGPLVIERLREFQIGQYIREEGPKAHQKKAGTPTMGGVLIAISIIVPTLLWADLENRFVWMAVLSTAAFAAIGFADDYTKVIHKRNLGLTARMKFGLQVLTSVLIAVALIAMQNRNLYSTKLVVPFIKQFHPDLVVDRLVHNPDLWPLAFLPFIGFVVFMIVAASNSVNLTDGLDGLAIGCTLIAAGALTVLTYVSGHATLSTYLELPRMPQVAFIGGVFVIEALSVILQVASYKLRKKRIFKMAPIHHHFELMGWSESKIIVRVCVVRTDHAEAAIIFTDETRFRSGQASRLSDTCPLCLRPEKRGC